MRHRHSRPPGLRRFVRARLHRRLFLWFGATILATVALVFATMALLDGGGSTGWRAEYRRAQRFVGNQFERVWDAPAEREALALAIARDLDVDVELADAAGNRLGAQVGACRSHWMRAPVVRDGVPIGAVAVCADRRHAGGPLRVLLPLLAVGGFLWGAAGVLSRRLARPLGDLERVAREIGAGNLSARVRMDCKNYGEVGVVAEAMNEMAARIERQLADQRELLAAVSHEMRTPLARVRLLTEMARDGAAGTKIFDDLDREVVEMDALVGDLLASSRLEFAALSLQRLAPAEAAVRALERAGLDPSLLDADEGLPHVEADPTLLARALANLIANARAHAGGVACLRVRETPRGVAFEVEDRGPGFADGDEARAFEPFYRRASAAPPGAADGDRGGSLGLGLALCKRIAEAHGGRAWAENRDDGGARVGIEIALGPPSRARGEGGREDSGTRWETEARETIRRGRP